MLRTLACSVLLVALAAGCQGPGLFGDGAPRRAGPAADRSQDMSQPVLAMPSERAVVASATLREEVDPAVVDMPFADGDDAWPPRDVALTYHGVQEGYDEFARPVPVYVFRFEEMVFVADDVEFGPGGVDIDGHYEPHLLEFTFDVAAGRLNTIVDLTTQTRFFLEPDYRSPLATWAVIGMAFKVFEARGGGDVTIYSLQGHDLLFNFTRFEEAAPLAGDCTPWELNVRWEPPWPDQVSADDLTEEADPLPDRDLLCMEAGHEVPLWVFSGDAEASYRLRRTDGGIATPPFEGDGLPPVAYALQPWQEVGNPLDLPVPEPLLAPPTSDGGRWAQEVQERAAVLAFSPGYLKYRMTSGMPYLTMALLNIQLDPLQVLNLTPPPLPVLGERSQAFAFFFLTDTTMTHTHSVTTYNGEPEGPDLHVPDPTGSDFPETSEPIAVDRLPPLVPDGLLEGQLGPLNLAGRLDMLWFAFGSSDADDDGEVEPDETYSVWVALQDCTLTEDGWFLMAEGLEGWAYTVGVLPAGSEDCREGVVPLLQDLAARPHPATAGQAQGMPSLSAWNALLPSTVVPGGALR